MDSHILTYLLPWVPECIWTHRQWHRWCTGQFCTRSDQTARTWGCSHWPWRGRRPGWTTNPPPPGSGSTDWWCFSSEGCNTPATIGVVKNCHQFILFFLFAEEDFFILNFLSSINQNVSEQWGLLTQPTQFKIIL